MLVVPTSAFAAATPPPPANDNFVNATVIPSVWKPAYIPYTTDGATVETGEPNEGNANYKSVWFSWIAPAAGTVTVETAQCDSSWANLHIYTGTAVNALTPVTTTWGQGGDPMCDRLSFTAVAGTTYRIRGNSIWNAVSGNILINRIRGDDAIGAIKGDFGSSWGMSSVASGMQNYTRETGEPTHGGDATGGTVWFFYTPTANTAGVFIDTLDPRGSYRNKDTILALYRGSPGALTLVATNDDVSVGRPPSRIGAISFASNNTYYLAVVNKANLLTGDVVVRAGGTPAANDQLASAVSVSSSQFVMNNATTSLATWEVGEELLAGTKGTSNWWKWTAPATGRLLIDTGATVNTSARVQSRVFTGPATGATMANIALVVSGTAGSCTNNQLSTASVTAGTTYYIALESEFEGYPFMPIENGSGRLETALSHDLFASPLASTEPIVTWCHDNFFAAKEVGEQDVEGNIGGRSLWYTWRANATGKAVVEFSSPGGAFGRNPIGEVYTGTTLAGVTPVGTRYASPNRIELNATANTTYRIVADTINGTAEGQVRVRVNPEPPQPQPVDGVAPNPDVDFTNVAASYTGWWPAVAAGNGVTSYDWCVLSYSYLTSFGSMTDCTVYADIATGTVAATAGNHSATVNGPFTDAWYYLCVKSITAFNSSYFKCSDGIAIDTMVAQPAQVNDGPSATADNDYTGSTTQLQATWSAVADFSGIARYETCYSTATACGGTILQNWTSQGTATTQTATGLTLVAGNTYYACVRTYDRAGNMSQKCSDGVQLDLGIDPLTFANDGYGTDVDSWFSTSEWGMSWSPITDSPSGVARYEYCISTVTNCAGTVVRSWSNGGTGSSYTATGLTLSLTTHFTCVRAVDGAGNVTPVVCSDGAMVFDSGPDAPTVVNDGAGSDIDWQSVTTALAGNWTTATDPLLQRHEYCISSTPGCNGTLLAGGWKSATPLLGLLMSETGLTLPEASTWYVSVRGVDTGNNPGNPRSSNGVTIDTIPPSSVTTSTTTSVTGTQPVVDWTAATDAHSGVAYYRIYRSTTAGVLGTQVTTNGNPTSPTWTDASLSAPGSYYYTVRAVDRAGNEHTTTWNQATVMFVPTYYLRTAASSLLTSPSASRKLDPTPGTTQAMSARPKVTGGTGYIQFQAGLTNNTALVPTLPTTPSGRGWTYDVAQAGTVIPAAEWELQATTKAINRSHSGTMRMRVWKATVSGGAITSSTPLSGWLDSPTELGLQDALTTTTINTTLPRISFAANEYLYVEYWESVSVTGGGNAQLEFLVDTNQEFLRITAPYVDTTASAPSPVRDGLSTTADAVAQVSNNTISANWDAVFDYNDVQRYDYCIATTAACTAPLVDWTSNGTAINVTRGGLALVDGMSYYVCVRTIDTVGNVSPQGCSNGVTVDSTAPSSPAPVNDGPTVGSDITWQGSTTTVAATWSASTDSGSGIARYDYCVSTSATCASGIVIPWTTNGVALAMSAAATLTSGVTYYTCARALDYAGNVSTACSNGVTVDATAPSSPAPVTDGLVADIAFTGSSSALSARWTASTDGASGIGRYDYCISTVTSCGGTPIVGWTSNLLAVSVTASPLALVSGSTYFSCARAVDGVGNVSAVACSDGQRVDLVAPPVPVVSDGPAADITWLTSSSAIQANWTTVTDAISGTAGYEYCISTVTNCGGTPLVGWTASAGTTYSLVAQPLVEGSTYYTCVRATDNVANVSAAGCSNGQTVDTIVPTSPATVNDGPTVGSDVSFQASATTFAATWSASTDGGSGLARYDYCVSTSATCASGVVINWTANGIATSRSAAAALTNGSTYYTCVRAVDAAGNMTTACSNGVTVDATAPTSPTPVIDGLVADVTYTGSSNALSARWTASTDGGSGLARYEYCISTVTSCGGTPIVGWTSNLLAVSVTASPLTLVSGSTYVSCARAIDSVGNTSAVACSNGQRVDLVAPPVPVVSDGPAADITWLASSSAIQANWTTVTDAISGTAGYEYCISTVTNCGGTPLVGWTALAGTSYSLTGQTLTQGAAYYTCARATDNVGNVSSGGCSNGQAVDTVGPLAPAAVRDGVAADIDDTPISNQYPMNWDAATDSPSGVARYDYCISETTNCGGTPVVGWTNVGNVTAYTRTGLSLVPTRTYYACIRAIDNAGNTGSVACSDGLLITNVAPNAPATLTQHRTDGTAVPIAGWSPNGVATNIQLRFRASDPDANQQLRAWVEIVPGTGSFGGTCGVAGAGMFQAAAPVAAPTASTQVILAVDVSGLVNATRYKWRACVVDQDGATSGWVNNGGVTPGWDLLVETMTVTSVTSNSAPQGLRGASATFTVAGTAFQADAAPSFGAGITVVSTTWMSSTQLLVELSIAGNATIGARTVTVNNVGANFSASSVGAFSVTAPTMSLGIDNAVISFGSVPGGVTQQIGTGSGDPAAFTVTTTSDTNARLTHSATAFTGPAALAVGSLGFRTHLAAGAWAPFSTSTLPAAANIAPGAASFAYDLQLNVPVAQMSGNYQTVITWTIMAEP